MCEIIILILMTEILLILYININNGNIINV